LSGLEIISSEFKSGFRSHARNSYVSFVFILQVREKKREREGRAELGEKDKARRKERKGRERPVYSVTDAFTHRPAPFTYWCDMEVAESCERVMCMGYEWYARPARPEGSVGERKTRWGEGT